MEIKVFYRISDKGRPKEKLVFATKFNCILNAMNEFGKENFYVIADNCNPETIQFLNDNGISYEETSLGNCGSFRHMCEHIFANCSEDSYVYLLEDDYVHLPGSRKKMEEGLMVGDYVTLYDHPDKYEVYQPGDNPLNYKELQRSKIFVTKSSHWREVNSTTMTFATKVATLKADYKVWSKYTKKGNLPNDFGAYVELTQNRFADAFHLLLAKKKIAFILLKNALIHKKTRTLVSCIPASATHAETAFLSPVVDWSEYNK